jgi:hypothetical protein
MRKKDRLDLLSSSSTIPDLLANAKCLVDKFHMKNHKVTDEYCQTNCNPKDFPFIGNDWFLL